MSAPRDHAGDAVIRAMLVALFALVVVRWAWVGDDAYITLRTVDNLVDGRGLVWNLGQRVQAYTHPLWLFLITPLYALTHEGFYTLLLPGLLLSVGAVALFARRLAPPGPLGWAVLSLFVLSRSFVDYSTSGLENPLSHLLLVVALVTWLSPGDDRRRVAVLSVTTGLALLNRMDTVLLHGPLLLAVLGQARRAGIDGRALAKRVALGLSPFLAWEAFSLVYYGALVPNTALAKLGTGIPRGELVEQGLLYVVDGLERDPLTLAALAAGAVAPFALRDRAGRPVAAGVLLYVAYTVWIGGDFMTGRFFTVPFVGAVALLARVRLETPATVAAAAVVLALGLSAEQPTLGPQREAARDNPDHRGIADERRFFSEGNSLASASRSMELPGHFWRVRGEGLPPSRIVIMPAIGLRGWASADRQTIVDTLGLADPFLARLPARYDPDWRVGHYHRWLPTGYLETIAQGGDAFEDPEAAALYRAVREVTRGRLFSAARWRAIVGLHTGRYRVDRLRYRYPEPIALAPGAPPDPANNALDRPDVVVLGDSGVRVDTGPRRERHVQVWRRGGLDLRLLFERDGRLVGQVDLPNALPALDQIVADHVEVPSQVVRDGYDAIRVVPVGGPEPWVLLAVEPTPRAARPPSDAARALLPPILTKPMADSDDPPDTGELVQDAPGADDPKDTGELVQDAPGAVGDPAGGAGDPQGAGGD